MIAKNPILEGFYPDPSICVAGEDFYLVNSTFSYFPGVPIFHSKNLRDWEQIGNVLNRNSQLSLGECWQYAGIYAPSIRYHKGIFYMITTNIGNGGNFYVTATNPAGPWSEPIYLGENEAKGIDPSLFFDEDDRCYYVGARGKEDERYPGDGEIWIQELDLSQGNLIGEQKVIYQGSQEKSLWAEGPHIYKKDGYYYVMIAEGGTEHRHSISIARSESVFGPYENNPCNPIITHRHFGMDYPVAYVGHGDLFEAPDKNWYMVLLASRPYQRQTMLGRETFLAKVTWEEGWPVVNRGIGHLEDEIELPYKEDLNNKRTDGKFWTYFEESLSYDAIMIRNPRDNFYSLSENKGTLRLFLSEIKLTESKNPSFIGYRQKYRDFEASTRFSFHAKKENEVAGIVWLQSNYAHLRLELTGGENQKEIHVIKVEKELETVLVKRNYTESQIEFVVKSSELITNLYYKKDGKLVTILEGLDTSFLCTEKVGGFCGCTIGMYASSNGEPTEQYADFNWFSIMKM